MYFLRFSLTFLIIYHYFHIPSTVIILKFIHNLASSKIKFSDSLTARGQIGLYSKVTVNL